MSDLDDAAPIEDGEILYRRIPISRGYHNPELPLSPEAFQPHPVNDVTGLSLVRGEPFNTPHTAGQGPAKQGYHLVVLRVAELRVHGIEVIPRPDPAIRGHVEIPALRTDNRESPEALTLMRILAGLHEQVILGPFPLPPQDSAPGTSGESTPSHDRR